MYNNLIKIKFKKYLISLMIAVIAIPFSVLTMFANPEKAKAVVPGTEIYAIASGGSGDALNKDNVTGVPDGNFSTVPSDVADRYVYGKTYTHALSGTITKVEIAAKYKVDVAFTDDEFKLKYKIGSTGNPDGATSYSVVPDNTSFSTYYLDITSDKTWTWNDITDLYVYGINNVIGGADGNNLLIDALWVRVTYSDILPTSAITYPINNYYYNSLTDISGTATDYSGTGVNVVVKIERESDNYFFDGSIWKDSVTWLPTTGTTSWSYSLDNMYLTNGESYTIYSKATDGLSHVQTPYGTSTFYYDTENPTGSILINDGADATDGKGDFITAGTTMPYVKLNFSYDDGVFTPTSGGDVKALFFGQEILMKVSNNSDLSPDGRNASSGQWVSLLAEKDPWYLSDGDGLKNVYVQFKDKAGNESAIFSNYIFYSHFNNGENQIPLGIGDNSVDFDDIHIDIYSSSATTFFYSSYGNNNPIGNNSGISFLGKYYDFNVSDDDSIDFKNHPPYLKIYYDDEDLKAAGITEDQLQGIYYYDFTSNSWKLYSNTGVDRDNNFVYAYLDHFTPMGAGGDITAPEKPANFTATAGDTEVELKWDKVDDAVGYNIRYRKATSKDDSDYKTVYIDNKDTVTTKITGLTNGVEYEFGISARDSAGNVSEYAVVVQTPQKKTYHETRSDSWFLSSAYAAESDGTEIKKDESKDETEGEIKSETSDEEDDDNGFNWSRFFVTLGILLLAAGAGFGGYYGYQWWMAGADEEEEETKKETKSPKKKNKRDNRW